MEDSLRYPFSGGFEFADGEKSCLGFMELLGVQDSSYGGASEFDVFQTSSSSSLAPDFGRETVKESSKIPSRRPATLNSSSISSTSSETEDGRKRHQREPEPEKTHKELKVKKTNKKKQKEPRFAFMTKSEVDHLEDGYRWRKYGQKAVKNSPYPRSYYRCTSVSCTVKKRVERCLNDPSIVVTTYEGQHTHPSAVVDRPHYLSQPNSAALYGSSATTTAVPTTNPFLYHYWQNPLSFECNGNGFRNTATMTFREERGEQYGLLQDAIPHNMQRCWQL